MSIFPRLGLLAGTGSVCLLCSIGTNNIMIVFLSSRGDCGSTTLALASRYTTLHLIIWGKILNLGETSPSLTLHYCTAVPPHWHGCKGSTKQCGGPAKPFCTCAIYRPASLGGEGQVGNLRDPPVRHLEVKNTHQRNKPKEKPDTRHQTPDTTPHYTTYLQQSERL